MARAPHLRAVDAADADVALETFALVHPETGERVGTVGDHVQKLRDQLTGAERDLAGWRTRYANLLRDKEAEAEDSPVWPAAVRVFDYWRERCRHPGSEWTLERFEMIRPHLERSNTGKGRSRKLTTELIERNVEICKLAIDGIAFEPFVSQGKNGRPLVHDGLHLIFGSTDLLEKRCKMAPAERIREVFPPPPPPPDAPPQSTLI